MINKPACRLKARGNDAFGKPFGLWNGRVGQSELKPVRLTAERESEHMSGRIVAVGFIPRDAVGEMKIGGVE